jgi:hypothetical protein
MPQGSTTATIGTGASKDGGSRVLALVTAAEVKSSMLATPHEDHQGFLHMRLQLFLQSFATVATQATAAGYRVEMVD